MDENLKLIFDNLMKGILPTDDDKLFVNTYIKNILDTVNLSERQIEDSKIVLQICNTIFSCTDLKFVNSQVWDLLMERYKIYHPDNFQVGSFDIDFKSTIKQQNQESKENMKVFMVRLDKTQEDKMLFKEELASSSYKAPEETYYKTFMKREGAYINKRNTNTPHNYQKLVGTLDKVKFVLNQQAIEKGVFTDSNVKVLERDFFGVHIQQGILNPKRIIRILLELKIDGVSAECDVGTCVDSGRSRGDMESDKATDLTPILKGYRFPNAPISLYKEPRFGMKFEAIITKPDLNTFNYIKNYSYKNCRTGIIGLFSGSDAYQHQNLITLVPLATSLEGVFKDRVEEIEFLNMCYATKVPLKYAVIEGDLTTILFQVKRFVEEAEAMRPYMGYMYDGVVLSYLDQDIIDKLPRSNYINKHTIAIKFNPEKAQTTIRALTITVGQDGVITPMIHYDIISFMGTTHTKSSIHSYERYKQLGFRYGNIGDAEYVNDVMPYVTKPDNHFNAEIDKANEPIPFPTHCPECQTKLIESKSGKNMICDNIGCKGRALSRVVNMMKKLNLKDFAEAAFEKIKIYSLTELLNLRYEDVLKFGLGEVNSQKFMDRMNSIKTEPIYDYEILGSLGIDNMGRGKWKLILNKYTLQEVMSMPETFRYSAIAEIKGLGPETARTLNDRMEFFMEDLITVGCLKNIVISKGVTLPKVRMTGFRDAELIEKAKKLGFDIGEGSVTKDTNVLLVPTLSHESPKVTKAKNDGILIMSKQDFINQYNL